MRIIILSLVLFLFSQKSFAQGCCSGGSGSPIAGGASQGVLAPGQIELASNFQYISSNKFKTENRDTVSLFNNYNSRYLYSKFAYGLTKEFTFSAEFGYYFNKTQVGLFDSSLNESPKIESSGFGDLILFPRYDVFNKGDSTTIKVLRENKELALDMVF